MKLIQTHYYFCQIVMIKIWILEFLRIYLKILYVNIKYTYIQRAISAVHKRDPEPDQFIQTAPKSVTELAGTSS